MDAEVSMSIVAGKDLRNLFDMSIRHRRLLGIIQELIIPMEYVSIPIYRGRGEWDKYILLLGFRSAILGTL